MYSKLETQVPSRLSCFHHTYNTYYNFMENCVAYLTVTEANMAQHRFRSVIMILATNMNVEAEGSDAAVETAKSIMAKG